jgi:hypothetical protein
MNQRIKLLADQARKHYPGTELSGEYWVFDEEKFAELIVRECNRYACSAWEHGPLLGRDLLIHFGVEK